MTESLSADGLGTLFTLRPGESVTLVFSVAGGETYTGGMRLLQSDDGVTWPVARTSTGTLIEHACAAHTGTVATHTVANNGTQVRRYRVEAFSVGSASNALVCTVTEVSGDEVEVLLRDPAGQPVLVRRDDGSIVVKGALVADSVEASSGVDEAVIVGGAWSTPAYNAANFSGQTDMTWAVEVGDVGVYKYRQIGKTMTVLFACDNSAVGGTAATYLKVAIPNGKTAKGTGHGFCMNAQAAWEVGLAVVANGEAFIRLYRATVGANWGAAPTATSIRLAITFEVN